MKRKSGMMINDIFILVLLFFASMNFKSKFSFLIFLSFGLMCLTYKKIIINSTAYLYLLFSILCIIYNCGNGIGSMLYCVVYVTSYILGYNLIPVWQHKQVTQNFVIEKRMYTVLMIVSCGPFIHYLLNFIGNYNSIIGRNTVDIWTGNIMAATGQAALASLMLGFSISMIFNPEKKIYRYLGGLSIFFILFYNLTLACRTVIVMLGVIIVVGFIYMQKTSKKFSQKMRIYLGVFLVILFIVVIYIYDIGGIQGYVRNSNLFSRFDYTINFIAADGGRMNSKLNFIVNGFKYPFGGGYLRSEYGYAHDLLLDGYDEYGICGLCLLVMILLSGLKGIYKLIRYTDYDTKLKLAILCVYAAILLEFMIEPILIGSSWMFAMFCLINGGIANSNKQNLKR